MPILVNIPGLGVVDVTFIGVMLLLTMASLMVFIEVTWMLYLATRVWTMYRTGRQLEEREPARHTGPTTHAAVLNARPATSADCDALDRALPVLSQLSSATVVRDGHSDEKKA